MEVSRLGKYKNTVFNSVVVIIMIMLFFNFIYKNQIKEINSLNMKKESEIKKNNALGGISQLEGEVRAYHDVLRGKDTSSIINIVSGMAKDTGVKIISFRPAKEQPYPEYIKSPFDLVINTSSFHALGKFIAKLESYSEVYIVDALSIVSASTAKELNVNLKLSSISLKD